MKLYVNCKRTNNRIYLTFNNLVYERIDIPSQLYIRCPHHDKEYYSNRDVIAEVSNIIEVGSGALLGGLVGALAGPTGVIVGAGLGSIITRISKQHDIEAVRRFNLS